MPKKITEREFKATYELGKQVYEGELTRPEAVKKLVSDYQMNQTSASISIQFLTDLLTPKEIKRTLSAAHVRYYTKRVLEDYGTEILKTFLKGLEYHIEYLEGSGMSNDAHRVLHNEFSKKIKIEPIYGEVYSYEELDLKQTEIIEAEKGIPKRKIELAYELAKQVYESKGEISQDDATAALGDGENMNSFSASHLIHSFQKLIEGEAYRVNLSKKHTKIYLENVLNDYGKDRLIIFLNGLEKNISHIHEDGRIYKSVCALHNEYSEKAELTPIYDLRNLSETVKAKKLSEIEIMKRFNDLNKNEIEKYIEKAEKGVRSRLYSGKYIVRVHKDNPRRPNTWGHRGYALLKHLEPISYEDYMMLGARNNDIKWDVDKKDMRLFDSKKEAEDYCNNLKVSKSKASQELTIGKPLRESWLVKNTDDYKIGFTRENDKGHSLDLYQENSYTWQDWVQHRPKNNDYNRKYVFTLVQFYHESDTWLFSGIFEVLGEEDGKYKMRLTDQLKEYVGRLKISHSYKLQSPRTNMEPHYSEFVVKEILDEPYFYIAEDSQFDGSKDELPPYTIDDIMEADCFVEEEEIERILKNLEKEKNLILQGPPGTGKTWLAKRLGYALVGREDREQVMAVQFHPNMSYEDFVMGYRPSSDKDKGLTLEAGTFLKFIDKAKKEPKEKFVMVIEEINRGNPVQIFGEMLTLLEADKRKEDEALWLCYQQEEKITNPNAIDCYVYGKNERVYIPENVYVIGTMNLTDKSLGVLDFAFRRRFGFIDLKPELEDLWEQYMIEKMNADEAIVEKIKNNVQELNEKIAKDPELGKQFCIGHSYFTLNEEVDDETEWFEEVVKTKIKPLLEEYWLDAPFVEREKKEEGSKKTETKVDEAINQLLGKEKADG